ncbi:hypothetical protein [Maribacter sp. 2210JD10-5]|uniref:lipid-binding SYLF domain-containing protein n=1 Tax=Maribacter sp. 2210JD10-5 TaxID=3386272 RepID=UPI0039BD3F43
MKKFKWFAMALFAMTITSMTAQTEEEKELMADAEKAKTTLIAENERIGDFFDSAYGYVIFPNVGKGGLIIGGASGNGIVYQGGTSVGTANLKKLNVGLQAGGQSVIEAIFFENETAFNEFKSDNYEFDAGISAVVLKSGKALKAKYEDGVAVFALPKAGLMADVTVGGQRFEFEAFETASEK